MYAAGNADARAVALVGIGCRFPGGVVDVRSFWRLLAEGRDAITEVPASRIDLERYFDPRPATPGRMMSRWGGFLDAIEDFDPAFFGISPREAENIDPQQRLLLETAWEAIEDAGVDANRLVGSRTGVYVGEWVGDFEARLFADPDRLDIQATTGSGRYAASGRVSYALGLRGPSLTIDSACSSSLAAVHLAVAALRSGECTLALAGGVNIILQPHISVAYSQSRMMAPDGHCKFGDARGDGYVRSEGAALVLLKPLAQALADGDRIYAVVRGSAVNNDGRSSGVMGRPSRVGHEEMLRSAYADAGVAPGRVRYVEAHGTGTRAGDPVEIAALGSVLGEQRDGALRCLIGSVKTNLGHTESAAGVAGLIKAALALHEAAIPASLHFNEPNPQVPWAELPFDVPTSLCPWPSGNGPLLAGVNSFGIAGTNAHVVLEAAPLPAALSASTLPARPALLLLSARGPEALRALARRYAERLAGASRSTLDDICWSAATRRSALEHRAAFVADDANSLAAQLAAFVDGEAAPVDGIVLDPDAAQPVFVVPGQGGQWRGMARELLRREPAFAAALHACDAAARPYLGMSIVEQIGADAPEGDECIDVIQPVLLAVSIAWARWLESFGIVPRALVGHSMGEVGAAHLAGVLDLDQAMRIICRRSALMAGMSGQGAMALVGLSMREAQKRLAGRETLLSLAASNGPASCVVSGEPAALAALMAELDAACVFCRLVQVDVASHSPQMAGPAAALAAELAGLAAHAAARSVHSTLLGRAAQGHEFDAAYWGRNLCEPVRFETCVSQFLDDGARVFVELGPHPLLCGAVRETAQVRGLNVRAQAFGRRDEPDHVGAIGVVASLWVAGLGLNWALLLPRGQVVDLPLYPWQRERHWRELPSGPVAIGASDPARPGHHPLLERRFEPAAQGAVCWETTLAPARFPWLADHVVRGSVLFPGVAYVEAALAAANEWRPQQHWALADIEFLAAWAIAPGSAPRLQVRIEATGDTQGRFDVHGLASDKAGERWERRATGRIVAADAVAPLADLREPADLLSRDAAYTLLDSVGLAYGPGFQGLRELRVANTRAVAQVQLDAASLDARAPRYRAFPPLLDSALQALAAAIAQRDADDTATPIPTRIGRIELLRPLPTDAALTLRFSTASGDVDIHDGQGERLAAIRGVVFERLRRSAAGGITELLHRTEWVEAAPIRSSAALGPVVIVCASAATAAPLIDALAAQGARAVHVPSDEAASSPAIGALFDTPQRGHLVHLSALECPAADDGLGWIEEAWHRAGDTTLALAQALGRAAGGAPPRVWLVTQRAVATGTDDALLALGGAALWGLGRVWAHEQPGLDLTLVDLDTGSAAELLALLRAAPAPRQLVLRAGRWLGLRLAAWHDVPATSTVIDAPSLQAALASPGEPDTLRWEAALRPAPQAHEVEIEVAHAGLNFMNLMSALGAYPGYENGQGPLGIECAGRVARIGAEVTQFRPGDAVIAIGHGCLQRHAIVHAELIAPRPREVSADAAAGLPIAFLTAIHALTQLARLEPGERVLIHSAAGGVGLAALQVARRAGAEVFATAGTEDKRALLRTMGVMQVFDSRGDFAEAVLAATGGRGVDVVLNSLAGAAIAAGMRCLAPYGRFVELGKRDIYGGASVALAPFRANLSYFAVDLDRMMRERPAPLGRLLREFVRDMDAGFWTALPVTTFAADDLVAAFKTLMPGTHVGKHVVALDRPPTRVHASAGLHAPLRMDGCHVVTGGLGALGLEVARWLARRGASSLMLIGRSAPTPAVQQTLREIEDLGTRVLTAACDVADRGALAAVLGRARAEGGPLRGVFHAAGVLADTTLGEMTPLALRAPREAKVMGARNLDRLTQGDALDAFVMFSSVAALFGTPGQGNYAAANAFLDALAHERRARNLPALSVAFGPVAGVGLAAASAASGSSLARLGFDGITAANAVEAIDRLVASGMAHAVCAAFDPKRWNAATEREGAIGLVEPATETIVSALDAKPPLRDALAAVPPGPPRRALIESAIKTEVGAVLRMAPQRVPADRALKSLGMDSLMALELRNRLEKRSGAALSPTLAWNYPTVLAIVEHLAERLQLSLDAAPVADAELEALLADLEQMSDDEARALLEGGGAA